MVENRKNKGAAVPVEGEGFSLVYPDLSFRCPSCLERRPGVLEQCWNCNFTPTDPRAVKMFTEGEITLPGGETAFAGKGGTYSINGDTYPVTILGWSKSGKSIFYRRALSHRSATGGLLFTDNLTANIEIATWRAGPEAFKPKGRGAGFIHAAGYEYSLDRDF